MSIPPFCGGCWREKWSPFLILGNQSTIFGHLKMGFVANNEHQKWYFGCPNPKTDVTFSRQHSPQNYVIDIRFVRLAFLSQFWNLLISSRFPIAIFSHVCVPMRGYFVQCEQPYIWSYL
jgi:hypothetical protein